MSPRPSLLRLALIGAFLWTSFGSGALARAQTQTPVAEASKSTADSAPGASAGKPRKEDAADDGPISDTKKLQTLQEQIEALIAGELDPSVDLATIFRSRLDAPGVQQLLGNPDDDTDEKSGKSKEAKTSPFAPFVALSPARREQVIEEHQERRAEYKRAQSEKARLERAIQQQQRTAEQLEDYLEGKLEPAVDPQPLLEFDLLAFLEPSPTEEPAPPRGKPDDAGKPANPEQRLARLDARVRKLKTQFALLSDEQKARLSKVHQQRRAAAEQAKTSAQKNETAAQQLANQAAEERQHAQLEAERAKTEAARLEAEETVRLLGVKEAQAKYRLSLAERRTKEEARRERSLEVLRKVREFLDTNRFARDRAESAEELYATLVQELSAVRSKFRAALAAQNAPIDVPRPESEGAWIKDPSSKQLSELQTRLQKGALDLVEQTRSVRNEHEDTVREDVMVGNDLRLRLMRELSADRRSELTSFRRQGVLQAKREFEQLKLEVWYYATHINRKLRESVASAEPLLLVFVLGKLFALTLVFRWWRRRATRFFAEISAWARSSESGPFGSITSFLSWYGQRTRAPLEWLFYLTVALEILTDLGHFPEFEYIEEIVLWFCLGAYGARLVDAAFARGTRQDEQAELRLRTLRTIAFFCVVVGLLLRLAKLSVGAGAIYSWATVAAIIAAFPLGLLLIVWWRPHVLLASRRHPSPPAIIRWAARNRTGLLSYVGTAAAGLQLLWEALYRSALRRAANVEGAQRILAYIFRRELERRATTRSEDVEPLPEEMKEGLNRAIEDHPLVESYGAEELDSIMTTVEHQGTTIAAVVAERGLGKTTFGERILGRVQAPSLSIRCQESGYSAMVKELARALGCPKGSKEEAVVEAVRQKELSVIWLDDATRLIRPLIGGLRDFDRFTELTRKVGGEVCWVLGVSTPAWNYLNRARGGRAVVDAVVRLPAWTEAQIHELCQRAAEQAGFSINYEKLAIPRQLDDGGYQDESERTAREFSRLLWDFAGGNPLVALHYFTQSLHARQGQVYAHLFSPPSTASLEDLPISIHFVLRSVIQLGLAREVDIVRCTGLPAPEVSDALRLSCARNYLRTVDSRYTVTVDWYRSITAFLRRQHLLIG